MEEALQKIREDVSDLATRVAVMDERMGPLVEGVSNFRAHSRRMEQFATRAEERWDLEEAKRREATADRRELAEERRARLTVRIAIWAMLSTIPIGTLGFVGVKAWALFVDLLHISQEWHEIHKSELPRAEPGHSLNRSPEAAAAAGSTSDNILGR